MSTVRYNVGKDGISGLIAQADTPIALENWFESVEDRSYVVKFSDYCAYMATYGREGYSNIPFSRAHKVMEMLTQGQLNMSQNEVNEIVSFCYNILMADVGKLLIKEACLYVRRDSDWKPFKVEISLPVVLLNYFGTTSSVGVDTLDEEERFVDVIPESDFNKLISTPQLMNILVNRDDITMQDITQTKGTPLEDILLSGITYLLLCGKNIKGRVTGGTT